MATVWIQKFANILGIRGDCDKSIDFNENRRRPASNGHSVIEDFDPFHRSTVFRGFEL